MEAFASLRERDAQYRLISDNSADVIWVLDLDTNRLSYVSPSVYKLRGYTPEEVMNQSLEDVMMPESLEYVITYLPGRIAGFLAGDESERVRITEICQPRKDGSVVETEVVTTLIPDGKGKVVEILGVSRDITERKETELRIKQAVDQINNNIETLAILNDQIRNPLAVLDLLTNRLEGKTAEVVRDQVIQIDAIINQLDRGYLYSEKVREFLNRHYNSPDKDENLYDSRDL
jgi:PAS domain S-box-containing protein